MLHLEPSRTLRGSECSLCWQHTLQVKPPGGLSGSECSLCWQHMLHSGPTPALRGSECRLCWRHMLHLGPIQNAGGSKCSLCFRHGLQMEPPYGSALTRTPLHEKPYRLVQILPGFRRPFGSKTCLMPAIRLMEVSPTDSARYFFLAWPMPCSPDTWPRSSAHFA